MPEDVREKVQRLIERAVHESTGENEARNAAMAACKLIAKHKLLEATPVRRQRGFAPTPVETPPSSGNPFEDLFRAFSDLDGVFIHFETPARPQRPTPPTPPARPRAPTPPQPSVARTRAKPQRDPNARQIPITDQPAFCAACSQRILRGKYATWVSGAVYHPTCYDNATEP